MLRYGGYGENMQHNKKHCPAIVGIYYYVDGINSSKEIARRMGVSTSSVWEILNRKLKVAGHYEKTPKTTIDAVEREYLAGESTYMLAEKYGVDHTTIGKWMKRRGHSRGKGWTGGNRRGHNKGHDAIRAAAIEKCAAQVEELTGGSISLVSYVSREDTTLRCNVCGHVFKRYNDPKRTPRCPRCYEKELLEIAERREQRKEQHRLDREAEYAKEKHCASCGAVFHSESKTQLYCSNTCSKREKRHRDASVGKKRDTTHRRRARKYGVPYDSSITVESVIERYGMNCRICGKPCDPNDKRWGSSGPLYPSVDCIVPMKKGGGYVWGNVQLAHHICNSNKSDKDMKEVIAHA